MDATYDAFFENLPKVKMAKCLEVQDVLNESPYLPPSSSSLGLKYRELTNNHDSPTKPGRQVPANRIDQGRPSQRHFKFHKMEEKARKLAPAELGISYP